MAQAFTSFDTYLAPFVKKDNLSYEETKQCIQSFLYGVNTPSRWGSQAPFTNVTIDWVVPDDLKNVKAIVGGKEQDFTYGDCQKEVDMINKAFLELMTEGDAQGRGFQYPIPTYSITKDFDWSKDKENNRSLFEMTAKYGIPYFSNYINSDMNPSDVRSMALLPDEELIIKTGDFVYKVLTKNGFVDIDKMYKIDYTGYNEYIEITLENGYTQRFSYDHRCPIMRGDKYMEVRSQNVQRGDKLLFNYDGWKNSNEKIGSYLYGNLIGLFFTNGKSIRDEISFEFNPDSEVVRNFLDSTEKDPFHNLLEEKLGFTVNGDYVSNKPTNSSKTLINTDKFYISVVGHHVDKLISRFIDTDHIFKHHSSVNEFISEIYEMSNEFRMGLLKGLFPTDTSTLIINKKNKEIYNDIITIAASVGCYMQISEVKINNEEAYMMCANYNSMIPNFNNPCRAIGNTIEVAEVKKVDASNINEVYNFSINTPDHLYVLPNGIITHQCCRLRLDLRELRKKGGGFFGAGESTGSIGVVTINMPRIAYLSKNEKEFYERLDKLMDIAARSLKIKRKVISALLEEGLYPYTKRYLGTFNNHFSTIGLVGMNEAGLNARWIKADMTDIRTQKFSIDVLNHMRERLSDYQELYGDLYNLEATPAESTTYRFAKHDKEKYPDIITANMNGTPYYTNSTHLPVGYTDDIFSALDIQDELQTLYTSGTVFHTFLGERLPNWESAMELVRKIAENYRIPYYTLSPTYSVCKDHGYIEGEVAKCPKCGKATEVYSRITGYYRPIQNWNDGKLQEFEDRKTYNASKSIKNHNFDENEEGFCESCKIEINFEDDDEDKEFDQRVPEINYPKYILLTTKDCPRCKEATRILNENNIEFEKVLAEERKDLVSRFDIMSAPAFIEFYNDDAADVFYNMSEIIGEINRIISTR